MMIVSVNCFVLLCGRTEADADIEGNELRFKLIITDFNAWAPF